jgi:hypothetical protein
MLVAWYKKENGDIFLGAVQLLACMPANMIGLAGVYVRKSLRERHLIHARVFIYFFQNGVIVDICIRCLISLSSEHHVS